MIKAKDLMVGNWFEHKPEWSYRNNDCKSFYFQWNERDWYGLGECTISIDNILPIKLTPDILVKCGFYNDMPDPLQWEHTNGISLFYYADLDTYRYNRADGRSTSLKHVHHLQNLYYALHGEQLKITLP